jgi:uncharacterized protein (TIGR03790 family)
VNIRSCFATGLAVLLVSAAGLFAGGSGLNVVVVVNQNSTNSVQLGNYYCEKRCVPPQNLLRITNWTGGNVEWTTSDFTNSLVNPLLSMLTSRGLTNQIDYVVLSMDFPYRVVQTGAQSGNNSTTAALFYGFKTDDCTSDCPEGIPGCNLPAASSNAYAASEGIFRQTPPISAGSNSWLVTMLTSSNLAQAEAIIDRSTAGDGTFSTQTVWLAKTSDLARNVRYLEFDNTIFDVRLAGDFSIQRTNLDSPYGLTNLLGYQTGLAGFNILPNALVPGAIADSLTSYAGLLYENSYGQTTLLAFMNAGASGSYGTVVEPCAYPQKFPSPQDYFYQARGFSLAECYYMSLANPYQGLIVGEPLAAPFARPPVGAWVNLPANSVLSGITNLTLQCAASASDRPVQQVDLFVDGTWLQTLTNIPPSAGNQLYVTINGGTTNYTVPTNATIKSVASDLANVLNQPAYVLQSKAQAVGYGDRIGLQSTDTNTPGGQISVMVSNSIGTAAALTTCIRAGQTNFLDTIAYGLRNFVITNAPQTNDYLQITVTKTNGTEVTLSVTNPPGNTSTPVLIQLFISAINTNASLMDADGLVADAVYQDPPINGSEFNLYARTAGWPASQIQVAFSGSPDLVVSPGGTQALNQNVSDLQPRNHLYVTAGVTNLSFTFPLDTTTLSDGCHELTAVVYEGSHVRTQARVSQNVRVQNTPLNATFATLAGAANTVLDFALLFSVAANMNTISTIELFTTGGSVGVVTNLSSATFTVAATNLGVGLHPFYAVVTRSDGKQYRTGTEWIRIGGSEPPFGLTLTAPPPIIGWPATAGRLYEVLSTTNVKDTFQLRGAVTPSNSPGLWIDTITGAPQQFYRVRAP